MADLRGSVADINALSVSMSMLCPIHWVSVMCYLMQITGDKSFQRQSNAIGKLENEMWQKRSRQFFFKLKIMHSYFLNKIHW